MLIVTFDEHGGCYDHVAPPVAIPPSETRTCPFNFDRYGVRVPAVIVSPYVKPGSIIKSPTGTPYDHTSIMATLRKRFPELGPPLTARVAGAPDVSNALTLSVPDQLGADPHRSAPLCAKPKRGGESSGAASDNMQKSLVKLAANLPSNAVGADPAASALTPGRQIEET